VPVRGTAQPRESPWHAVVALLALATLSAACTPAARSARASAPSPSGWWMIEAARPTDDAEAWSLVRDVGVPGAAWRFVPAELQSVRPGNIVDRVVLSLRRERGGAWELTDGRDEHLCSVEESGGRLTLACSAGGARVSFRRARPEEVEAAEHALLLHETPEVACARASACAAQALGAFPYLGDYAPREPKDLRRCEGSLLVFERQYRATGRKVPEDCTR